MMTGDNSLYLPKPRGKTQYRDATPAPQAGDALLIWLNRIGLWGEARLQTTQTGDRLHVTLSSIVEYAEPRIDRKYCTSQKGQAGRAPQNIFDTLGVSSTEIGGTILLSDSEIVDLDAARRSVNMD